MLATNRFKSFWCLNLDGPWFSEKLSTFLSPNIPAIWYTCACIFIYLVQSDKYLICTQTTDVVLILQKIYPALLVTLLSSSSLMLVPVKITLHRYRNWRDSVGCGSPKILDFLPCQNLAG